MNEIVSAPISFFFAPFQEGNTWPEAFEFDEPLHDDFGPDEARVDGRLKWYNRVEELSREIDATDLQDLPASFGVTFDGSDFSPQDSSDDPFHGNVPALRQKYEIPSLKALVSFGSRFELISHRPATQTAEQVTPGDPGC